MSKKTMFDDLKEAIRNVLVCVKTEQSGYNRIPELSKAARILQAEYNIYFVEPDDEQLEILQ